MQGKHSSKAMRLGIKAKVLAALLPVVAIVIAVILLMVYSNTSAVIIEKSEELLSASTQSVVNNVGMWMNETLTALKTERDVLEFFPMTREEEIQYIKHTANQYDAFPAGLYIANTDGVIEHSSFVPGPGYSFFQKEYYIEGLKSNEFIFGSAYYDESSLAYVVWAAGALKDQNGAVRGVAVADIYLDAISKIVQGVRLEETGGIFLVDTSSNMVIGHQDQAAVGKDLKDLSGGIYTFTAELLAKQALGLQTYTQPDGNQVYVNVEKIPNSQWVAVAHVPNSEVMAELNQLTQTILIIAVCSIALLFILVTILISLTVAKPVKAIDFVARRIADGDLNQKITYQSRDEFGELSKHFNHTVERLRSYVLYIDEISAVLDQIAGGNLDFQLTYDYAGEFLKIKTALEGISSSLNGTLGEINQVATQVAIGSGQVSDGSQALSQGATEQASAVEELASSINTISQQIQDNASNAEEARTVAAQAGEQIMSSNQKMRNLTEAIAKISEKSGQIDKIIKTIEDIAFQTNILALNAAVEAARAGNAGKGFAVVADEVRNLASKSSEAAKNTTALIEETVHAVENGTKIAEDTASFMLDIVDGAKHVSELVDLIATASEKQAVSTAQVSQGIDQIASVVQTNSATAEESAAASVELSGQAQSLKNLVGQFHLKDGTWEKVEDNPSYIQ